MSPQIRLFLHLLFSIFKKIDQCILNCNITLLGLGNLVPLPDTLQRIIPLAISPTPPFLLPLHFFFFTARTAPLFVPEDIVLLLAAEKNLTRYSQCEKVNLNLTLTLVPNWLILLPYPRILNSQNPLFPSPF